jgi:hypothetical protein
MVHVSHTEQLALWDSKHVTKREATFVVDRRLLDLGSNAAVHRMSCCKNGLTDRFTVQETVTSSLVRVQECHDWHCQSDISVIY